MTQLLQSLWIGESIGPLQRLSIASFLRLGGEYHLYAYGDITGLPSGVVLRDAREILPASAIFRYEKGPGRGSVAAFSNVFRYKLLLDRGGWWVDTDVVCLKPFGFTDEVVLASEHRRVLSKVATAVMKLPAGHDVAHRCYERAMRYDRNQLSWGQTGPDLLTQIVGEIRVEQYVRDPVVFCPVPWWRWNTFAAADPSGCHSRINSATYSVHLWHEMWRRAGRHRQLRTPVTSYVGQLLEQYEGAGVVQKNTASSPQAAT